MIMFSVPADFKVESLPILKNLERQYPSNQIRELFGNLSGSKWPSGHGFLKSQKYAGSIEELAEYVAAVRSFGYDFNYTFNSSCLENQDILASGQNEILNYIGLLHKAGVNRITIASPPLMIAVHKMYPELMITASAIACVNSIIRAKKLEQFGINTFVFDEDITRDIKRIQNISEHTTMHSEIIVNSKCTFNCLYRMFHYNSVAHDTGKERCLYHYGAECALERYRDPVQYIKSLWIRPEDIECYHTHGVELFKIIGRERLSSIDIPRMVQAYFSRSYDGNLIDLLHGFSNDKKHIYIDNKKLDGFMDKFINEEFECFSKCTDDQCGYCKKYLEEALDTTKI